MGHLHKALVTYERAFQIDPNDPDLLLNLGLTAWNLKMIEGAEKMFQLFIAARPEFAAWLQQSGHDPGRPGPAVRRHRDAPRAIFRMPTEAVLWNSLATVLAEDGRADESIVFYQRSDQARSRILRGPGTISALPMRIWACSTNRSMPTTTRWRWPKIPRRSSKPHIRAAYA